MERPIVVRAAVVSMTVVGAAVVSMTVVDVIVVRLAVVTASVVGDIVLDIVSLDISQLTPEKPGNQPCMSKAAIQICECNYAELKYLNIGKLLL